ncbi:MAG: DUF898 domain-containing protein [Pseudomonadales bacterium]|nr:DUF898 domain-containing protein [Pseudomonadales bacterium]
MNETPPATLPLTFSGKGGEYFKIWIVNILLSILTLGIYSAWAKVRNQRYFLGNTNLDNAVFEYHATPMMILKGRLVAIGLLVLYLIISNYSTVGSLLLVMLVVLVAPWAIWRSIQFNARMVSYRNVHFSFHGSLGTAYKLLLLIPFLPIIIAALISGLSYLFLGPESLDGLMVVVGLAVFSSYLLVPYVQKAVTSYYINFYQYGQGKFSANLSTGKFYSVYLVLVLWSILLTALVGIAGYIAFSALGLVDGASFSQGDLGIGGGVIALAVILAYVLFIAFGLWGKAYLETKIRNYVLPITALDDAVKLNSSYKVSRLFGIYLTNLLLIVVTLGLAYPFAAVRLYRYRIEQTSAIGDVTQFVNQQHQMQSALAEELGEAFDMELGLSV